jgi:hypothetical protein
MRQEKLFRHPLYSNILQQSKRRPALVIAELTGKEKKN